MDENFDFQEAVNKVREMLSGDENKAQLVEIMNMLRNNSEDKQNDSSHDFDPALFLKMQKILSLSNSDNENEKAKLLLSLKPFLKEERRDKVDKAVKLMNISKIISAFKDDL